MTRKIKALGLAFVAVLAMSAVASSAAQATTLTASAGVYPITVKGEQATENIFTIGGNRQAKCANAVFDGVGTIAAPTEEVTLTPTYSNCTVTVLGSSIDMTVTFPCHYLLTSSGLGHLVCNTEGGTNVQLHFYSGLGGAHTEANEICTYVIKPQTIEKADFTNQGSGATADVLITATAEKIAMERTKGTLGACGAVAQEATYTGTITAKGFNSGGVQVGIHVK